MPVSTKQGGVMPEKRGPVFQGPLDVAEKVHRLLGAEGIRSSLVPLPFVSRQRVEGNIESALRDGEVHVSISDLARSKEALSRNRTRIDEWHGIPADVEDVEPFLPPLWPPERS